MAYAVVRDDLQILEEISFGELLTQARSYAQTLIDRSNFGDRILLVYPAGLDFVRAFWACMLTGRVAVPVPAPDPLRWKSTSSRLASIQADAGAPLVLSTRRLCEQMRAEQTSDAASWITLEGAAPTPAAPSVDAAGLTPRSIAYLQYTSGSTAAPRGAILTHANVLAQCAGLADASGVGHSDRFLSWLPHFHDYGLVNAVLLPVFLGAPSFLMSPITFLRRPLRWLEAIDRFDITCSGAPNFAYATCTKALRRTQWHGDLSRLRIASCGAEPIQAVTVREFESVARIHGFRDTAFTPAYGMAETVLGITVKPLGVRASIARFEARALRRGEVRPTSESNGREIVGCGFALPATEILIVDPETRRACPIDRIGEIWVRSPSVGQGYWEHSDATAQTFAGVRTDAADDDRYLRTGDLGFLFEGQLYVTGRLKDLIIIRGANIAPQDIEFTVQSVDPVVRAGYGAAFSIDGEDAERLVIAQEIDRQVPHDQLDALAARIKQAVADQHTLAIHDLLFLKTGSLPRTSSGKIQRQAAKHAFLDGALQTVATYAEDASDAHAIDGVDDEPDGLVLTRLRRMIAELTHCNPAAIDPAATPIQAGLDSLSLFQLHHGLEESFGAATPSVADLGTHSLQTLAQTLERALTTNAVSSCPASTLAAPTHPAEYPLTASQQTLWFAERLHGATGMFNLSHATRLLGPLDAMVLENSLRALIERHAALHTAFVERDGIALQSVRPQALFTLEQIDFSRIDSESTMQAALAERARRPFDLNRPPLLRATLIRLSADEHVLQIVVHHLVFDGWSAQTFARELALHYRAGRAGINADLEPAQPYGAYAQWRTSDDRVHGNRALDYWTRRLNGYEPVAMPTDRPRPSAPDWRGGVHRFRIGAEDVAAIRTFAQREGVTLYTVLLGAFQWLLARLANQDDIIVGTPAANRTHAEFSHVIGLFTNTLPIRTNLASTTTFRALLHTLGEQTRQDLAHQDIAFDALVRALDIPRDAGRNPLYDIGFALQSQGETILQLDGLHTRSVPVHNGLARTDLWLALTPSEETLLGELEFSLALFDCDSIERLAQRFVRALRLLIAQPDAALARLSLIDASEQRQLLEQWNATASEFPTDCMAALVEQQVARTPAAQAVRLFDQQLSYAELNARANQLAHALRALGVGPKVLVGVCMERSLELVVGLLAVIKAGGAYVPLDPQYPRQRLALMLSDTRAPLVLTQAHLRDGVIAAAGETCRVLAIDTDDHLQARQPDTNPMPINSPEDPAYVIFTSGSTGHPKAVLIPHRAMTNHKHWIARALAIGAEARILQKTTISFDAAVWEFFTPLMVGAPVLLARPGDQRDTAALLHTLRELHITHLVMAPSAARALLAEPTLELCTQLRYLLCGGEALDRNLAREYQRRMPWLTIGNFYGPSETTEDSTFFEVPRPIDGDGTVPIGRPIANTRCYVLDARMQPQPIGVVGELYIAGAGVSLGYLDRPEATAERFLDDPFAPNARMYRTGDLARYRADGNLEFIGRADGQIKLRGHRIELGEIEAALMQCAGVTQAAVVLREDRPGHPRLAGYVTGTQSDPIAIKAALRQRLPDYMVPSAIMELRELPLMPNGKLDRRRLPAPEDRTQAGPNGTAPDTATQRMLAALWAEVLGTDRFGIDDSFFDLGGHSLLTTQVVSRLRERHGVDLPLRAMFDHPTIAALAARIDQMRDGLAPSPGNAEVEIRRVDRGVPLPASFSQRRMWLIQQFDPAAAAAYNVPISIRLRGPLDLAALRRAFDLVVRRHEAFRTTFVAVDGEPMQCIGALQPAFIETLDLRTLDSAVRDVQAQAHFSERAAQAFDLNRGPLHRICLAQLDENEHALLWVIHHAITDNWSVTLLMRELRQAYDALRRDADPGFEPIPIEYADYASWQRGHIEQRLLETQRQHWIERLTGLSPTTLPTDHPRPLQASFRGARIDAPLSNELLAQLRQLGARESTTPFVVLLACFKLLVARYSCETDIAVGTPIANRTRFASEHLVGTLVNTLVMRTDLSGNPRFVDLLARVRATTLDAYAHQDMPFDKLVEDLGAGRGTLVHLLFNMLNAPVGRQQVHDLQFEEFDFARVAAQFDLSVHIDAEVHRRIYLEYATDLFAPATARRLLDNYLHLVSQVLVDPERAVADYAVVAPTEERMRAAWNATAISYPDSVTIHRLLEARAALSGRRIAIVSQGDVLTHAELDARANKVARTLRAMGVGRGQRIGLCLERTPDMLIALLGILKSGAAYVPLDPAFPAERLTYMAEDADISVLVARDAASTPASWPRTRSLLFNDDAALIAAHDDTPLADDAASDAMPSDPAYVIYTSGSTGKPKGVVLPHRAVVNFLTSMAKAPGLLPDDRLLAVTTLSFDIAVLELLLPLTIGARIVLANRDETVNGRALARLIDTHQINVMQATPSTWRMLIDAGWNPTASFKALVGGEALSPDLASALCARASEVWNMYGPTETTVWSTCWKVDPHAAAISIGHPIANTRVYVLDEHRQPSPIGAPGEIYIAGDGVALGYLDRPELTSERFVTDPFDIAIGARMYRTGDRGRWRHDGLLEHLGRLDLQIKVRGHRMEPGEIEAQLAEHAQVAQCIVLAREDVPGDVRLTAYVVGRDQEPEAAALRAHLRRNLPDYMIPQHFVVIDAMPLLPNGKIDRRALPAPNRASQEIRDEHYIAPGTREEIEIARIWGDLLGMRTIGLNDNFFELGGHSLLAMQAIAEIERCLGVSIAPRRLVYEALGQIAATPRTAAKAGLALDTGVRGAIGRLSRGLRRR